MTPLESACAEQDADELAHRNPNRRYEPMPTLPAMVELDRLIPRKDKP